MRQDLDEWVAQRNNKATQATDGNPLDTTGADTATGKQPRMSVDDWLSSKKPVTGSPEDIPSAPIEKPEEVQEEPKAPSDYRDTFAVEPTPYSPVTDMNTDIEIDHDKAKQDLSPYEKYQAIAGDFLRDEGLPIVGGLIGGFLAPVSGGTSIIISSALVAGATGAGAFIGEGVEQTLKYNDVMDTTEAQGKPKDAWDILERSTHVAGREAVWALVPDLLVKGATQGVRKLLFTGAKPAVNEVGEVLDLGRHSLQNIMMDYAEKHGLDPDSVLLTSDVVESGLFNAAEDVASNSYIQGKVPFLAPQSTKEIRKIQEEAIKEKILDTVGSFMKPAEGYVKGSSDLAIKHFVEANMAEMNDFAVAGLVNVGFKNAQKAQKAIASAQYKTIGGLMEATKMQKVFKEVELPFLDMHGKPMTTMQEVITEQPVFPVDLTEVRDVASAYMEVLARTNGTADSTTMEIATLGSQVDYTAASVRLMNMKADSRSLGKSLAEGADKNKHRLDAMIKKLEPAMDAALKKAEEAGIKGPDGTPLSELKTAAASLWEEQTADFKNSYIRNILKNTDPKNGAPEKLGRLFMQNETSARDMVKILEDAKGTLKGEQLEQIMQAENSIKGSIVEEIFMPFDSATNKFIAPDMSVLTSKSRELERIFGKESFDELKKLGAAIEQQTGSSSSNYLGFSQRAREAGMVMSTLKGMARFNFEPLMRDGGATLLFSLGAGRLLTSPKNIRYARMIADPKIDPATKTYAAQILIQHTYEYQQQIDNRLTPEDRERIEADTDDRKEASSMRK